MIAKKNGQGKRVLLNNLLFNNPVLVQALGICSTLAVTNKLGNTFIMTAGVSLTTAFSSATLSAMKSLVPAKVRMMVQVLVISFYVILIDIILRAYLPEVSKALGPYVGLIITNCIIMGRAEAFAQSNPPLLAFWDGLTSGLGYMAALLVLAFVRELLGFGTVFGLPVLSALGGAFQSWTIMIMAPSAFFLTALLIWALKSVVAKTEAAGGRK